MSWTMNKIKKAVKAAGSPFFAKGNMAHGKSQLDSRVFEGPGGVFFLTSEDFGSGRTHAVRRFDPDTGRVSPTPDGFRVGQRSQALALALQASAGRVEYK